MRRRTGFLTNDVFDLNAGDPATATNSGGSGRLGNGILPRKIEL